MKTIVNILFYVTLFLLPLGIYLKYQDVAAGNLVFATGTLGILIYYSVSLVIDVNKKLENITYILTLMNKLILIILLLFITNCKNTNNSTLNISTKPQHIVALEGFDIDGDGIKNDSVFVEKTERIILLKDTLLTTNFYFYRNNELVQKLKDTITVQYDYAFIFNGIDTNDLSNNFINIKIGIGDCSTDHHNNYLFYWDKNTCLLVHKYVNESISNFDYYDTYFRVLKNATNSILISSIVEQIEMYDRPTAEYMDWVKHSKFDSTHYYYNGKEWKTILITPKGKAFWEEVVKYDELYTQ